MTENNQLLHEDGVNVRRYFWENGVEAKDFSVIDFFFFFFFFFGIFFFVCVCVCMGGWGVGGGGRVCVLPPVKDYFNSYNLTRGKSRDKLQLITNTNL